MPVSTHQKKPYSSLLWSQITLEGFKSYKEQTVAEPFSSRINVVGADVSCILLI